MRSLVFVVDWLTICNQEAIATQLPLTILFLKGENYYLLDNSPTLKLALQNHVNYVSMLVLVEERTEKMYLLYSFR